MDNINNKPMLSSSQLITKMREEKGITFRYTSESETEKYLDDINNYLRVASYRQNYQKHLKGINKGKYIDLDFSYLQELSIIDMHLRFLLDKMCSDIEHAIKVQLIRDITNDINEDGYSIVKSFINQNQYLIKKLGRMAKSPFTGDLLKKYFTVKNLYNGNTGKNESKITAYDDCPIWVLCEFLSFGDLISLYEFYYIPKGTAIFSHSILNLIRSLRNAAAHNNCILANLQHGTSYPPKEIMKSVQAISTITNSQIKKKLSCRPMLEFVSLLYVYNNIVTEKVKKHRIDELKQLFYVRMIEKRAYFKKNEMIKTNYEFVCKVIEGFFN